MKLVDLYGRVRYAVRIEGISSREAARRFGIDPRTVAKMLSFSVPPGYRRTQEKITQTPLANPRQPAAAGGRRGGCHCQEQRQGQGHQSPGPAAAACPAWAVAAAARIKAERME